MYDWYGDGWNGSEIDIFINGSYYTSTYCTGSNRTFTFTVAVGAVVTFEWWSGSYWDDECYFFIDEGNNTLYSCYDASYLWGLFFTYTCGGGGGGVDPPVTTCVSDVVLNLNSSTPAPHLETDGFYYIDVCPGQTINFVATATPLYANLSYTWSFQHFNNGPVTQVASGRTVSFTPSVSTGYNFILMVVDGNGCKSFFTGRIRVSSDPITNIAPSQLICSGSTEQLTVGYSPNSIVQIEPIQSEQEITMGSGAATFIPDGPNCPDACYTSSVVFTNFASTDVLQNASDIISLCINLEHSYTDDLSIYLVCPNGSSSLILNNHYLWRSGLMFGVPNFTDSQTNFCNSTGNPSGTGWTYCWSENSSFSYGNYGYSDMYAGLYSGGYAFDDYAYNAGNNYSIYGSYGYTQRSIDSTHISSGSHYYSPVTPFSSLVGCPLNGEWQIQICDTWAGDNGYVFYWDLTLNPNLISPTWSYNVPIDHVDWSCNWATVVNDSTVNVSPPYGTPSGTYDCNFTIYDDYGCAFSGTYPIQVSSAEITSTSSTDAICGEPNGTATVVSPNAVSYQWNTTPAQNTATATGLPAGTYIVTVTDANGCTATASVVVSGSSTAIDLNVIASSLHLCPGETAVLTATGANSYLWSTGATSNSITVGEGTYTVTGSTDGCDVTTSITIYASPPMSLTIDTVMPICNDPNGELTVHVTGGTEPFQYLWSNGATTQTIQNIPPGTYTVTVTDAYQCTISTTVVLTSTAPVVTVSTTQAHCGQNDGTATLIVTGGEGEYSYFWNIPDASGDCVEGLYAGTYTGTVRDSVCEVEFQFNITEAPLPNPCFGVSHSYVSLGTPVKFIDCSSPNVTWFWDFGDGTTSYEQNPIYIYPEVGNYTVVLTVTDIYGCTNSVSRPIFVYETAVVYVPNSFTPNSDGKNDVFKPTLYNVSPDNYELIIYNRWGEEIFKTTDSSVGWNGTIDGKPVLTNTVFVYLLYYTDYMGAKFMKKGTVTIVHIKPY